MSVSGEALSALAYLVFVLVFALFVVFWRQGRIDRFAGEKHVPRVAAVYGVSTFLSLLLHAVGIYCYWVPVYRLWGLLTFLQGVALFVASLKSLWAFMLSTRPKEEAG